MQVMSGGTEFMRAEEKQRELLMEEVKRLMSRGFSEEELQAHFAMLLTRYFQIHTAKAILDDVLLVHHFMRLLSSDEANPLAPVVNGHNERDRRCNAVTVC